MENIEFIVISVIVFVSNDFIKSINNVRKTEELNQINSTKLISKNGENYDIIYYPEDNENRVYCNVCNIFYIDRFFKKHLKSKKHINNQIISSNLI